MPGMRTNRIQKYSNRSELVVFVLKDKNKFEFDAHCEQGI
jgi:hypothetical protein